MNLPHKLPEIDVFLTDNGLKSILEKRTMTPVTTIKTDRLSGQQSRHDLRKACGPRANEKVGRIGQKGPGVTRGFCGWKPISSAIQQMIPVPIVLEYIPALNSTNKDMVEHTRGVESGLARHSEFVPAVLADFNLFICLSPCPSFPTP